MDMEDKETAPGTVLLAVDVARRQAELRRRSVIMTEDPVEAAEWLRTYRHPMTELISIGPWASYSAFNQGAGVDLPRLLLSDRVRSACAVEVAGLDYAAQQAKYLFSYEDAAEWIEANVETRVMSVVVPLSIFATDPDALRAGFEEEKRLRFTNVKTNEGAAKPRRILARWNVVKNLAKEAREAIGNCMRPRRFVSRWPGPCRPRWRLIFQDAYSPATALRPRSSPRASARTTRSSLRAWLFTARSGATGRTAGGTSRRASCSAALETGPTTRSDWST